MAGAVALDDWQALGIISAALLSLVTLLGLTWRWGVRPVWRTLRRLNEVADLLLGDKERDVPSLQDRLGVLNDRISAAERRHAEHLSSHVQLHPNGPTRPRR
jgi:hypothetical protein